MWSGYKYIDIVNSAVLGISAKFLMKTGFIECELMDALDTSVNCDRAATKITNKGDNVMGGTRLT